MSTQADHGHELVPRPEQTPDALRAALAVGAEVTAKKGTRNWKTQGKVSPATRRPIIEILDKSANTIQKLFDDLADVGQKTTETTTRLAKEAAEKTAKDLTTGLDPIEATKLAVGLVVAEVVLTFRSHMDKAGMDAAVSAYHEAFGDAAGKLYMLEFELDEALLSVPTFQAERARAQGFGARSLNEFKKEHSWQLREQGGRDAQDPRCLDVRRHGIRSAIHAVRVA